MPPTHFYYSSRKIEIVLQGSSFDLWEPYSVHSFSLNVFAIEHTQKMLQTRTQIHARTHAHAQHMTPYMYLYVYKHI